ncbi:uncharacterized protein LOC62_05G007147 [Vanrija pseudolonga]|uniref:Uncharacterized protein n=1 Tax=Vanrija pseudolonga TaxID=143232 RepID=A0AAF0YCW3_9TREE|nr:hypothetical protein LOC62_05G007147 [Vanrija pseudolonga]
MSEPPPSVHKLQDKEEQDTPRRAASEPPPLPAAPNPIGPPAPPAPTATYSMQPRAVVSEPGPGLAAGGNPVSHYVDPYVGRRVDRQREYRPYERYWTQAPTSYERTRLESDDDAHDDTDLDTAGRATPPARVVVLEAEVDPERRVTRQTTSPSHSKSSQAPRSPSPVDHGAIRTEGHPTTDLESETQRAPGQPRSRPMTGSDRATLESYYPMLAQKFGPLPSLPAVVGASSSPDYSRDGSSYSSSSSASGRSPQDRRSPATVPLPGRTEPAPALTLELLSLLEPRLLRDSSGLHRSPAGADPTLRLTS